MMPSKSLAAALSMVLLLAGCIATGPEETAPDEDTDASDTGDAARDEGIATKSPPLFDVRLNDSFSKNRESTEEGFIKIDGEGSTVLYYDLHLRLQNEQRPVNITVSWAFAASTPVDAEVIGTYAMTVAPAWTNMTLPVVVDPDRDLSGEQGQLRAVVETEPETAHSSEVLRLVFD